MSYLKTCTPEDTSRARLQASPAGLRAFEDATLMLSVHWGLYALQGRGEWVMFQERIPWEVYRGRVPLFNPVRFNAEEWADLMLEAGCRGLVITSKHHDGFCLWDTALTDWKVTNTPFRRDPIAELAAALGERGLRLYYYYSLLDWTHPAYKSDWPGYLAYYQGQVRELLTNYGPIGSVIFDGYWPRSVREGYSKEMIEPRGEWDLAGTYDLMHTLQPDCVVINNHHVLPLQGEDAQVSELDMPGENTAGFNTDQVGPTPQVVWWNLNAGWAYAPRTHRVKSADTILADIHRAREHQAVFYLNVGPRSFGDIHPDEACVLRQLGARLRQEGSA